MDKQRFSSLLKDPSQVTNSDIKALNEYRKKYSYFQSLYVVVAKALKEREHPKTEAFIKKAAIYSANRSHLKTIIEGEYPKLNERQSQPSKKTEATENPPVEQPQAKKESPQPASVPKKEEQAKAESSEQDNKKETTAKKAEKEVAKKAVSEKEVAKKQEKTSKQPTENNKKEDASSTEKKEKTIIPISETTSSEAKINQELAEIEATKKRIEALLSGQLEQIKKPKKKSSSKSSGRKKSQIEIIEKFIKDQPQIDKEKIAAAEAVEIEDLAGKSIKEQGAFETETLAKLMVKQGKLKKAEKIYEKLSLKFPEKSTYFVSQIQKLKSE